MSTALNLSRGLEGIVLRKQERKEGSTPPMVSPRLPSAQGLPNIARWLFRKVTFVTYLFLLCIS